jgi:hypothetical protein
VKGGEPVSTTRTLTDLSCSLTTANASNVVGQTRRTEIGNALGLIYANYSSMAGASGSPYATILSSIGMTAATASVLMSYAAGSF